LVEEGAIVEVVGESAELGKKIFITTGRAQISADEENRIERPANVCEKREKSGASKNQSCNRRTAVAKERSNVFASRLERV